MRHWRLEICWLGLLYNFDENYTSMNSVTFVNPLYKIDDCLKRFSLVTSPEYFKDWARICFFRKIRRIIWPHRCHSNNFVSYSGWENEGRARLSTNFDVLHDTRLKFYAEVCGSVEQTHILDVFRFLISLKKKNIGRWLSLSRHIKPWGLLCWIH